MFIHPSLTERKGKVVSKKSFGTGEWLQHILKSARAYTEPGYSRNPRF
jgi:hypothetical protein